MIKISFLPNSILNSAKAVGIFIILMLGTILYICYLDQRQWDQFAIDHHCKVTGHQKASSMWGMKDDGKMGWIDLPAKTIYTCDGNYVEAR